MVEDDADAASAALPTITIRSLLGDNEVKTVFDPTLRVSDLQRVVTTTFGLPAVKQLLIFDGGELTPTDRTLSDCGVHADSIIHLVTRTDG